MNTQFKKGVLELIVLMCIQKKDMYGYELVTEVSMVIDVNDGTIYPILKRLTNEKYFDTYLVESKEGPSRKYYHITDIGVKYLNSQKKEWDSFNKAISKFMMECV